VLQALPAGAKKVAHVEADAIGPRRVAILTLTLHGDEAQDLAHSGALPAPSGGPMLHLGRMLPGGPPPKDYTVDVALSVDPDSGDVLRLRAKVYEDDPMLANMRIQIGGPGGEEPPAADEPAPADKTDAQPPVKKGLPERKPGKTESVLYYRVDFKDLGRAEPPALDEGGKRWLGLQ
jgi:hypothetical protein